MAEAILRPSAEGTYTQWTLGAGASKAVATDPGDPISHDENTSYITADTSAADKTQSVYLDTGLPLDISEVTQLDFTVRSLKSTAAESYIYTFLRLGSTNGAEEYQTLTQSYADYERAAIARPGGGSWVKGDFVATNLQGVVRAYNGYPNTYRTTSIWCVLTYVPVVGGFVFHMLFMGPLIALGLHEMPALARALQRRTEFLIQPHEYERAWREWREHRFPRHFLIGSRPSITA
jgi:hypothetical protein